MSSALRVFEGFVAQWDFRTRNPSWVLEHLTPDSFPGGADRAKDSWHEDKGLDVRMRSHLADFRGCGYDRGHMAAAANHKKTQEEQDQTFCLTNISPQVGEGFNRTYWARFEKFCRGLTTYAPNVYVVTGPLWLPTQDPITSKWDMKYTLIGEAPSLVSVPTHFYKVIMADSRRDAKPDGPVGVAAFVMPNAPIEEHKPLAAFLVPLSDLESVAGVSFFPGYLTEARRDAVDHTALSWRDRGLAALPPFERHTMRQTSLRTPLVGAAPTAQLLAGTSTEPSSAEPAGLKRAKSAPAAAAVAVSTPQAGAHHLCEVAACLLPRADFFKAGKDAAVAAANKAGRSGGL